jgi:cysteine desulfurase
VILAGGIEQVNTKRPGDGMMSQMDGDIYLDYAAGAALHPAALEAYASADVPANPHALHRLGRRARAVLDQARADVAEATGAGPAEVIFTSGGTEADGLAVQGIYLARQSGRRRPYLLIGATEHPAVRENARLMESRGGQVVEIPVDSAGVVSLAKLERHLVRHGAETALISVMAANNETGTLQPVDAVVELAGLHGVPVHSDWVALLRKQRLDFGASGLAAVALSAHKVGGPVGLGVLLVQRRVGLEPLIGGGGQERDVRSGTVDARAAAAFAAVLRQDLESAAELDQLLTPLDELISSHPALTARTPAWGHLPGLRNFTVADARGETMVYLLDKAGLAVSTGSACSAGVAEPSHVLAAMGLDQATCLSAIRVSIGPGTTPEDISRLIEALPEAVDRAQAAESGPAKPKHSRT